MPHALETRLCGGTAWLHNAYATVRHEGAFHSRVFVESSVLMLLERYRSTAFKVGSSAQEALVSSVARLRQGRHYLSF